MLIRLYNENPNPREIARVVALLKQGAVIIYPTDSLYAFGCDITQTKAVERICALKGIDPTRVPLSFVCSSIAQISEYAQMPDRVFKLLKSCLPGPFTFLLNGNSNLPKLFKKKKTVGVRIPDNAIATALVQALGNPILSTSVFVDENEPEYATLAELMEEQYEGRVDCVIDGGEGDLEPSTIIDCTTETPVLKRKGKGIVVLD